MSWKRLSLIDRIHWMRYILPPLLVVWVVTYQLAFAQAIQTSYGHMVHYAVEIAFYSMAGPVVTWLTLTWVERKVREKEQLEEQVRHVARQKEAVLEEERARIARDLHDGVAQTLYFLALKADMLRRNLQADDAVAGELHEMGQTSRQVIREVRRTIFALQPLNWPPGEFLSSLRQFVTEFAEQVGWQTAVFFDDDLVIPSTLEPQIFRLVQESLNNVAKHADATQITVMLKTETDGRYICLEVNDNGRGFEMQANGHRGLGLKQMATRAEAAKGTFIIQSEAGRGTTIMARLPLKDFDHG